MQGGRDAPGQGLRGVTNPSCASWVCCSISGLSLSTGCQWYSARPLRLLGTTKMCPEGKLTLGWKPLLLLGRDCDPGLPLSLPSAEASQSVPGRMAHFTRCHWEQRQPPAQQAPTVWRCPLSQARRRQVQVSRPRTASQGEGGRFPSFAFPQSRTLSPLRLTRSTLRAGLSVGNQHLEGPGRSRGGAGPQGLSGGVRLVPGAGEKGRGALSKVPARLLLAVSQSPGPTSSVSSSEGDTGPPGSSGLGAVPSAVRGTPPSQREGGCGREPSSCRARLSTAT